MSDEQQTKRRTNLTDEDVNKMRELEAAGKSRKEISMEMNVDPASVTRKLGSVRAYRGARAKIAA
jgi:ribosomal protein S13